MKAQGRTRQISRPRRAVSNAHHHADSKPSTQAASDAGGEQACLHAVTTRQGYTSFPGWVRTSRGLTSTEVGVCVSRRQRVQG